MKIGCGHFLLQNLKMHLYIYKHICITIKLYFLWNFCIHNYFAHFSSCAFFYIIFFFHKNIFFFTNIFFSQKIFSVFIIKLFYFFTKIFFSLEKFIFFFNTKIFFYNFLHISLYLWHFNLFTTTLPLLLPIFFLTPPFYACYRLFSINARECFLNTRSSNKNVNIVVFIVRLPLPRRLFTIICAIISASQRWTCRNFRLKLMVNILTEKWHCAIEISKRHK